MTKGYFFYMFVRRNGRIFGPYKHHRIWMPDGTRKDTYLGRASQKEYEQWKSRR